MNPPAVEGPYFEDLTVGQVFATAPGITLWPALAAAHQAITGDRLALALDVPLCREVTGGPQLVSPALAWDVAIGQSTIVTQHVKANLFYRGLAFRRIPRIGDTLRTTTTVDGLRQNRPRPGRAPTGLAALRITTVDQDEQAGAGLLALRHAAAARSERPDRARRLPRRGRRAAQPRRARGPGRRLAAGPPRPAGGWFPAAGPGRGPVLRGGRGRRGDQRAGAGPAHAEHRRSAPRQRGRGRPGASSTAATPSAWRATGLNPSTFSRRCSAATSTMR